MKPSVKVILTCVIVLVPALFYFGNDLSPFVVANGSTNTAKEGQSDLENTGESVRDHALSGIRRSNNGGNLGGSASIKEGNRPKTVPEDRKSDGGSVGRAGNGSDSKKVALYSSGDKGSHKSVIKHPVIKSLDNFYRREGLSSDKIELINGLILEEVQLEKKLRTIDDEPSYKAIDQARDALKTRLGEICGQEMATEIVLLKESAAYRFAVVSEYAGVCAASGVPLDPKAIDDISVLMYVNKLSLPDPTYTPISQEAYNLRTMNDAGILQKASRSLNQEQLRILEKMLSERFKIAGK